MATAIAERVNKQHASGFDLNDDPGGDLLSFTTAGPGLNTGAARTIELTISDPRKIAASNVAGAPGSNKNANLLFAIKDEKFLTLSDETANQFYASLIYDIGSEEKTADDNVATQAGVLTQLKNHRNSLSGVNLDEEAINLIKYQKAYQASAKFATVLDALSQDILNMLGV